MRIFQKRVIIWLKLVHFCPNTIFYTLFYWLDDMTNLIGVSNSLGLVWKFFLQKVIKFLSDVTNILGVSIVIKVVLQ